MIGESTLMCEAPGVWRPAKAPLCSPPPKPIPSIMYPDNSTNASQTEEPIEPEEVEAAIVRPFGKHILLQFLELITLASTWMTLWAGTVFNMFPRCEDDKGVAVGWCNALSIFIGLLNIASVVAVHMQSSKHIN